MSFVFLQFEKIHIWMIKKFEAHECRIKNIDQYFPQEDKEITDIDESTINFIGKNQLPLNLVTKTSFREFASNLMIFGQKNPQAKTENLFPSVCRQTFTKHFIHYSDKSFLKKTHNIYIYIYKTGSCLAVDAGKHKSISYLMVILANARIQAKPLVIDCIRYFGGKQKD